MAPRKKQITEIEKTQNGTLPSFCQAVTKRSLDVIGTLLFWHSKFRDATIQADNKLGEYPHDGLVNVFQAREMDPHLRRELAPAE
jgi:hypothetical protein